MAEAASLIEWIEGSDPWALIGYAVALLFAVRRGMDAVEQVAKALERVGRAPDQVRAWLERRAARIVSAEREREALQKLIANSERILAQFETNGGSTIMDAVIRVETKLDAHLAEQPPILNEHNDLMARVTRLEQAGGRS